MRSRIKVCLDLNDGGTSPDLNMAVKESQTSVVANTYGDDSFQYLDCSWDFTIVAAPRMREAVLEIAEDVVAIGAYCHADCAMDVVVAIHFTRVKQDSRRQTS